MIKLKQKSRRLQIMSLAALMLLSLILIPPSAAQAETPRTIILPMEDWIKNDDVGVIELVNQLLEEEVPVMWAQESFTAGGVTYPAGTFYFQTPFTTRLGVSSAKTVRWLKDEAKNYRVWRIDITNDVSFTANAQALVLPRITLFYDTSTYLNALVHYQRFQELGFKVVLANAVDLYSSWWNDTSNPLSHSNVFVMPGGALHLYSFPYGVTRANAIANITEFLRHGGGYIGVCAGATESLIQTPYTSLDIVNASYSYDWFDHDEYWEPHWRTLIGPISLSVEDPTNPVTFGYGPGAVRPGYEFVNIYYYGGPAIVEESLGPGVEVLGRFEAPITQLASPIVENIWGSPGILTGPVGEGQFVTFSPHPEWPGPGARIYAQALYYVADDVQGSRLSPSASLPADITAERVNSITSTVAEIKPILAETMRVATEIVNLRAGDHYFALGLWYDSTVETYAHEVYEQLNDIQRDAVHFQYEYHKLNLLKASITDPVNLALIDEAQGMIESWFYATENFASEPHQILPTSWAGEGPFMPFEASDEATSFDELVSVFEFINNETVNGLVPIAEDYLATLQELDRLVELNRTAYTSETNSTLLGFYANVSASYPAGDYYKALYAFQHTSKLFQYKVDYHLLNLITIGDRTREILSFVNHVLAGSVGSWSYAIVELQAIIAHPGGRFT
ncbi:MAG: BPL-N domain-containing protein [Candidatus Thorarchaeota archaeon]